MQCFQGCTHLECPTCHRPVASALFDRGSSEWYVGIQTEYGIHCCFKVTSDAKLVAYQGWWPKWRRLNGRLNSIKLWPLEKRIVVV